eukprot:393215_1
MGAICCPPFSDEQHQHNRQSQQNDGSSNYGFANPYQQRQYHHDNTKSQFQSSQVSSQPSSYKKVLINHNGSMNILTVKNINSHSNIQQQDDKYIILSPREIYYTQESIRSRWSDKCRHSDKTIHWTLNQLQRQIINLESIPNIKVVFHNNRWYSLDNRRLWVFKQFGNDVKCKKARLYSENRKYFGSSVFVRN